MEHNQTKKYFVLSDIHGRPIGIEDFEQRNFDLNNPNHIIVLLGDYFDRGDENLMVLRFIEKYKKLLNDRFIVLKGNHDEFIHKFITYIEENFKVGQALVIDPEILNHWFRNGGEITLNQLFGSHHDIYTPTKQKNLERLKQFYNQLEDYYETEDYIFTHACINEERQIDTWDRFFLHEGMKTDKTVVIGHTTHDYLINLVVFFPYGLGIVAQSLKPTLCPVYNIDNGRGNNIVVFEESN